MKTDYRKDLYEQAEINSLGEKLIKEFVELNDELNSNKEFNEYLNNLDVDINDKKERLKAYLSDDILACLFNIYARHTYSIYIHELVNDTLKYAYEKKDVYFGKIYSVNKLSKDDIKTVEQRMSKIFAKETKLENIIDPSLISGIRVDVNDYIFDNSYQKKLDEIKNNLLNKADLKQSLKENDVKDLYVESKDVVGHVLRIADNIVTVSGLYNAKAGELLLINNENALVMNLNADSVDAVLLSNENNVIYGDKVYATGRVLEVPVGDQMMGRVVNALGKPIDSLGVIESDTYYPIERNAPAVIDRQGVNEPLETGILIIDSVIPIGKGQRELIIGDRQTGKTSIAVDTIINQKGKNVKCVYVAIGQKNSTVAHLVEQLRISEAMEYTTVVVAGASDAPSLQYIAPYSATSIAEYWMEKGDDVLIIYDDLSKHAVAYRTLSLLLKRPPGREAYPGDVFYLHSRLLERSAKLSDEKGGGSLTALPIIETLAGDISAYIPTNVISITDGQIFLQTDLFNSGIRPAVDSGLSVSRVGSSAQTKAMKKVSGSLKLDLSQYHEVAAFIQFGSDLDASTKRIIKHGEHLSALLIQPQYKPLSSGQKLLLLIANQFEFSDNVKVSNIQKYKNYLIDHMELEHKEIMDTLETMKVLDEDLHDELYDILNELTRRFKEENE